MIFRSFAVRSFLTVTALALVFARAAFAQTGGPGFLLSEFVADNPPTISSHASTIVESDGVLMSAWFGGSRERARDVSIWLSQMTTNGWSEPVEVANGVHDNIRVRYPCWNPVLFKPTKGPLTLFYKEGPSPESWWGMVKTSDDNGITWSNARKLPRGMVGPVRSKPVEIHNGFILCPSSTEDEGWAVHMERVKHPLKSEWFKGPRLNNTMDFAAIQPTLLQHEDGRIQALCRTKNGKITEMWTENNGATWTRMKATHLPNPNSAVEAVTLADNRGFVLIYNHSETSRDTLHVATSQDGRKWNAALVLESETGAEFSYPAAIQSADGKVHVTYTWKRQKIRHVVLDPVRFNTTPIIDGHWPR